MGAPGMLLLVWLFWPLTLLPILSSVPQLSCLFSSLPGEPSGQGGEWWSQGVAKPHDIVSQRSIKASWAELRPEGNTGS